MDLSILSMRIDLSNRLLPLSRRQTRQSYVQL